MAIRYFAFDTVWPFEMTILCLVGAWVSEANRALEPEPSPGRFTQREMAVAEAMGAPKMRALRCLVPARWAVEYLRAGSIPKPRQIPRTVGRVVAILQP